MLQQQLDAKSSGAASERREGVDYVAVLAMEQFGPLMTRLPPMVPRYLVWECKPARFFALLSRRKEQGNVAPMHTYARCCLLLRKDQDSAMLSLVCIPEEMKRSTCWLETFRPGHTRRVPPTVSACKKACVHAIPISSSEASMCWRWPCRLFVAVFLWSGPVNGV